MSPSMLSALAAITAITGVVAVSQLVGDLVLRDRAKLNDRVDTEFLRKKTELAQKKTLFKDLGKAAAELSDEDKPTARQKFVAMIEQSGIDTTPAQLLTVAGAGAAILGLGGLAIRGSLPTALVLGAIGFYLPIFRVQRRRDARIEKLRSQLADAFELMARVIRAGQTLSQALLSVGEEFPDPIAAEFAYCYEQQNLGLSSEATFRDLTRRTGVIELKIFVLAVLVQQQTGGNLSELLGKLASVVRERYQIRGTIATLTAEGGCKAGSSPPSRRSCSA